MKPTSAWPVRVPVERINMIPKGEYHRMAGHLHRLGFFGIIAEEESFQVDGKEEGAGLFGVEKCSTRGPVRCRVTRLLVNMIPSNSADTRLAYR